MKSIKILAICLVIVLASGTHIRLLSQSIEEQLNIKLDERSALSSQLELIDAQIIDFKLMQTIEDMKALGMPSENYIEHSAMILEYDEAHEQAKWVAHMILPEIRDGKVARTNDFRIDNKILTGSARQQDYFLTDTLSNGKVEYNGFGYDRGHLAASADFRWSAKALSESYYYSNISPQLADFNREAWKDLESLLRNYVISHNVPLYVVTMPILKEGLPVIQESSNKLSIPEQYAKVAYDPVNKRCIGFIMDHRKLEKAIHNYAVTVDEVEELSGLDFFTELNEAYETVIDKKAWFDNLAAGDVDPIAQPSLPPGHFNTVTVAKHIGYDAIVCGKIVSSRYSKKGNLWLNLDKAYPKSIFNIFIRKEHLTDFEYDITKLYENQTVCVEGKVQYFSDNPTINIKDDSGIRAYQVAN